MWYGYAKPQALYKRYRKELQKLGKKILNKIIEKARDSDVIKIFLEVRPSNSAAISLYEKKGFFKIAYRPNYYRNIQGREDAEVLCLSLKNPY